MKLYTEEQLRTAFIAGMEFIAVHHLKYEQDANEYINSINPIELPSDEDIKTYVNSTPYYGHCTTEYCEGIEDGIKWIIDKIKGDK